jgi:hypothetical protein
MRVPLYAWAEKEGAELDMVPNSEEVRTDLDDGQSR